MAESNSPNPTAEIDGPAAMADLVRDCAREQLPIIDYGIAHRTLGNPPPERHVQLTQIGGVIEHYERDMTIRVAAGAAIGDLRKILTAKGQFLPLDADDDITLGEALMHNAYGPLRLTYGSTRDLTLGLRYIDGEGQDIHVGGRTVKNVAGYDVNRFMVGSLGQFGLVYEATLRTYALLEQAATAQVELADPQFMDGHVTDWLLSDAAPTWMELRQTGDSWRLSVGYYGRSTATNVQLEALRSLIADTTGMHLSGSVDEPVKDLLTRQQEHRAWRRSAKAVVKVVVPPATTGQTCHTLSLWAADHEPLTIEAVPTHGCIFAGGDLSAPAAVSLDDAIMGLLAEPGGVRAWYNRPPGAEGIKPFGPPQDDWGMIERLRRAMDPNNLFNPGRFLPVEPTDS